MPEQEIDFTEVTGKEPVAEAVAEETVAPSAPEPKAPPEAPKREEPADEVEQVESDVAVANITLTLGKDSVVYEQKPLTYFNKVKFLKLIGKTLDETLAGGGTVGDMLVTDGVRVGIGDLGDVDSFLRLAASAADSLEDFLKDCYCLWLNVPKREQEWAKLALEEIDDETGIQIIERFVAQNWKAIERFFTEYATRLQKASQKARNIAA